MMTDFSFLNKNKAYKKTIEATDFTTFIFVYRKGIIKYTLFLTVMKKPQDNAVFYEVKKFFKKIDSSQYPTEIKQVIREVKTKANYNYSSKEYLRKIHG